ncbi:hypothetical protein BJ684DRAFT_20930 [Piptocephalis cylindrospora]|uniref:UBR-type domain-containing protein n=1 Tax=Piptocephalis cylindrospora TaxID=1907219 RepID=A0A4P9Y1X0_9FUNG|nr:hypothetical protein BJ684DRAFT_20930 [Piptocephalis cylindrospora]|eukprot:RKP12542.1 hypothetical protein BJ684DRAFT_20930 [Piptocephalis cylindrospora]
MWILHSKSASSSSPSETNFPDDTVTAEGYLEEQERLEHLAARTLPYRFDACSRALVEPGSRTRQTLYVCLRHVPTGEEKTGRIMCYACSISCHADCELVELFTKRGIGCDCGAGRMSNTCSLVQIPDATWAEENARKNRYNHNAQGLFCWCNETYDPEVEASPMYQCIVCEDWFHDRCIKEELGQDTKLVTPFIGELEEEEVGENRECKESDEVSQTKASAPATDEGEGVSVEHLEERKRSGENLEKEDDQESGSKRVKMTSTAKEFLKEEKGDGIIKSLFLVENWKELVVNPHQWDDGELSFLLADETVYLPEKETDSETSLFRIGMNKLPSMPRETSLTGLEASEIKAFLSPFAEDGRVVTADDVRDFFAAKLRAKSVRR